MADTRIDGLAADAAGLARPAASLHARRYLRAALAVLLVGAGYYVAGVLALSLQLEPGGISAIWLPQGVLLAALVLTPPRRWWLYLVAALFVYLQLTSPLEGQVPIDAALVRFAGDAAQAVVGAIVLRRLVGIPPRFDVFRHMIDFMVLGLGAPALVVSAGVAGYLFYSGRIDNFDLAWHRLALANICGALLLAPAILATAVGGTAAIRAMPLARHVEFAAVTLGVLTMAMPALEWETSVATQQALIFAPLPLLLWTAVRFGPGALALQLLIVAVAVLTATKAGHGPFVAAAPAASILIVQAYLLSIGVPKLLLAALVAERNRAGRSRDQRLEFERLISEVSTSLINPLPGRADEEIENALRKVRVAMDLDRCSVYRYDPETRSCRISHSVHSDASLPAERDVPGAGLPWLLRQLQAGVTVVLNDVGRDLPPEADVERRYAAGLRTRSWLAVPVTVSQGVMHGMSFHSSRRRQWSPEQVSRLQLLAEIFISTVTKRQAEAALKASEERYREVVESQTELVCRYLPDTTLTFVNEAYCRYFGRSREELIGRRFLDLVPAVAQPAVVAQVESLMRNPRVHTYEHEVTLADGTTGWQQWVDSAIVDSSGRVVELQGIGRDITDRKRAEEATQRLAQASRLSVMGELTASIAHELNQPLNAILNNADAAEMLLESGPEHLGEVRRILADIRRDDLRASEVIRRTRELLSRRPTERHPIDLNEVAGSVLDLIGNDAIRRRVELATDFAPDLPPVLGDRVHLQQVLLNLILNGMEAMADAPAPRRRLTVRTGRGDGAVEVAVSDCGHGLDRDKLALLFESFYTTKKDGMGLGLSLARSIVEAHGGRIWAVNRVDGGATFRFTVPAASR